MAGGLIAISLTLSICNFIIESLGSNILSVGVVGRESRSKMVPVLMHLLLSLLVVEGVDPVGLAVRLRRLEGLQLVVVVMVCLD